MNEYVELAAKERIRAITYAINEKERIVHGIGKRADVLKTEIEVLKIEQDELTNELENA